MSFLDSDPQPPLACSVRGCAQILTLRERALACAAGHSFDIARGGWVNLLQPNDRRSLEAGDARRHVDARIRLRARGVGAELEGELGSRVNAIARDRTWIAEVGCGPGFALQSVARAAQVGAVGCDLSSIAVQRAASRAPALHWIVVNADRRLPFADESLAALISVAAPKQPGEFRRVLARSGRALVAVPAQDDLIELREAVLGEGRALERADRALAEFASEFELEARCTVRERRTYDAEGLRDLLDASYRGAREREAFRARALDALEVTTSCELLVLRPR